MKEKEMKMVKTIITHTETKLGYEKVTKKEGYLPGEPFKFSEEDKLKVLSMIQKAGLVPVDDTAEKWFILYLEYYCTRLVWMQGAPKREDHRDTLNEAKKSFKKTIQHLKILENDYLPVVNLRAPDPYMAYYFSDAENQAVIQEKANIAKEHLNFLIKEIQKYEEPKRDNWKTSHGITTQFFIEVARILDMQFVNVKFTTYKTGFFMKFCENLLTIMKIKPHYKNKETDIEDQEMDITRACRYAIDALAEQKKKPLYCVTSRNLP